MSTSSTPLPPPLPEEMRIRFRDYPEHIAELERALASFQPYEYESIDPFERVLWVLESTLSSFAAKARDDLGAAEERGDTEAAERGKAHLLYMLHSLNPTSYNLDGLYEYFQADRSAPR